MSTLIRALAAACVLTADVAAPVAVATSSSDRPTLLTGVPREGSTGLRLLVADAPPFLLDVDRGRKTRISGLRAEW